MTEPFVPTKDAADTVLRRGRQRRRAKVVGATGSSLLTLLVAVVLVNRAGVVDGQEQRLIPASTAPSDVATALAAPNPKVLAPSASPSPQTVASPGPLDQLTATPTPGATAPPPAQERRTSRRTSPIRRGTGTIGATDVCRDGATVASRGACVRALPIPAVRRGVPVSLGGEFCVLAASQPQTVQFPDTREIDLSVSGPGAVLWEGGEGIRNTRPGREVTVQPGRCLRWTSVWDTRDREGFVVPPGDYLFVFRISTDFGASIESTVTVVD